MFGRDQIMPLNTFLESKVRYLGDDQCRISLEKLQNIYDLATQNLRRAREKYKGPVQHPPPPLQVGDMVLVKNHVAKAFEPHYMGPYRILAIKGNQLDLRAVKDGKR